MAMSSHSKSCLAIVLAAAAGLALGAESYAPAPKHAAQHFSFHGQRPTFHEDNIEDIEVVVSSADSEGRMSLVESYWLPAFAVESHYHRNHAETFYIISGRVEWTIGGVTHEVGPGDAVHIPPNTPHSVRVVGGGRMHSLMLSEPGGFEENVADAAGYSAEERRTPEVMQKIMRRGDFHPVGP